MARLVLTNAYVTFASTDLSDHIASVSLNTTFDIVETTAFGDTAKKRVAGLAELCKFRVPPGLRFRLG